MTAIMAKMNRPISLHIFCAIELRRKQIVNSLIVIDQQNSRNSTPQRTNDLEEGMAAVNIL